jgi:Xaa-Pro dipeptidase
MEQAVAAIRPGVSAREIFEVAVSTTRLNGISAYSRHHCGHGIGVEMYDLPSIDQKTDMLLEKDMVLCIETPYYEIDWGGVQLESTVAVTDNGVRYLDKGSRDLIMLE